MNVNVRFRWSCVFYYILVLILRPTQMCNCFSLHNCHMFLVQPRGHTVALVAICMFRSLFSFSCSFLDCWSLVVVVMYVTKSKWSCVLHQTLVAIMALERNTNVFLLCHSQLLTCSSCSRRASTGAPYGKPVLALRDGSGQAGTTHRCLQ